MHHTTLYPDPLPSAGAAEAKQRDKCWGSLGKWVTGNRTQQQEGGMPTSTWGFTSLGRYLDI